MRQQLLYNSWQKGTIFADLRYIYLCFPTVHFRLISINNRWFDQFGPNWRRLHFPEVSLVLINFFMVRREDVLSEIIIVDFLKTLTFFFRIDNLKGVSFGHKLLQKDSLLLSQFRVGCFHDQYDINLWS